MGGAALSVSVIGSSAEYLWRWYSYASDFGSLAEWAAETAHAAAEVTAHAAAVTAVVLETVEAAAETDHALETVDASAN